MISLEQQRADALSEWFAATDPSVAAAARKRYKRLDDKFQQAQTTKDEA